jgi:hypothetical protein
MKRSNFPSRKNIRRIVALTHLLEKKIHPDEIKELKRQQEIKIIQERIA